LERVDLFSERNTLFSEKKGLFSERKDFFEKANRWEISFFREYGFIVRYERSIVKKDRLIV